MYKTKKKIEEWLDQFYIDKLSLDMVKDYQVFQSNHDRMLPSKVPSASSSVEAYVIRQNDPLFLKELERKKKRVEFIEKAITCLDGVSSKIIEELYLTPISKRKKREQIANELDISLQALYKKRKEAIDTIESLMESCGLKVE